MPESQSDCLFCAIATHKIDSTDFVYEDEKVCAFLTIGPVNAGHTLVIPKAHARDIYDITPEDFQSVMEVARVLSPIVKTALRADGINIIMNNEKAAGQVIFHPHVHIIPRKDGDGFQHWHGEPYKDGEATRVAECIRATLNDK